MPLEIRELVIKTTISDGSNQSGEGSMTGKSRESSINEILERIFEILKEKSER